MKNNITLNEFSSLDSTLESPSKPHPETNKENFKNIFLVHYVDEPQPSKLTNSKKSPKQKKRKHSSKSKKKLSKNNSKITVQKNNEFHLLDFDLILKNIIEPKKKILPPPIKKPNNNSKKKLLSHKRKRFSSSKKNIIHKSKYYFN